MPYTKIEEQREMIDSEIDNLIVKFRSTLGWSDVGSANYMICRTLLGAMKPVNGWNYDSLSDVIKTLECAKLEIARRLLAPYEDKAKERNGDLYEFSL